MTRAGSGSLPRYILQRILLVIPMVWIILTLVFFVLRVAPGDPVSAALGGKIDPQALEQRREALGFNRPLSEATALWAKVELAFRSAANWPLEVPTPCVTLTLKVDPPSIAKVSEWLVEVST